MLREKGVIDACFREAVVMTRRMLERTYPRVVMVCLLLLGSWTAPVHAQGSTNAGSLNMVCAPVADWCEAIVAAFTRETGVKVNMVRKSSGEILAQLRAEAQNPKIDLWFGSSTDTHFAAAELGLLQAYTSPNMAALLPWAKQAHVQSGGRSVGITSSAIGIMSNREVLAKKGIPAPQTWADLIKPIYKGEVQMPNPNASGTAYTIIAGFVQMWGEDKAFAYLTALHANVNAYTRSGAAPTNATARGETGVSISFDMGALTEKYAGFPVELAYPAEGTSYEVSCMALIKGARNDKAAKRFYDWYLTPKAMDIGPTINQWFVPAHPDAAPNAKLPDASKIKLIDYDFAKFGAAATRRHLLERWDREIGALSR
jgi:iron(III) transport system substrate-binding protein